MYNLLEVLACPCDCGLVRKDVWHVRRLLALMALGSHMEPTSQPGSTQKTPRCTRKRPASTQESPAGPKRHPGDPQVTCDSVLINCSSEPAGTRRGTRAIYPTASGRLYVYGDHMNSITFGTRRNPRGTRAIKRSHSAAVCTNRKIPRCQEPAGTQSGTRGFSRQLPTEVRLMEGTRPSIYITNQRAGHPQSDPRGKSPHPKPDLF